MFGKKDKNAVSEEKVQERLGKIVDPELKQTLAESKILDSVKVDGSKVRIGLKLPTPAWGPKDFLQQELETAFSDLGQGLEVEVAWGSEVKRSRPTSAQDLVPTAQNVILFASGKGGVGKSTVATNIATALAKAGARVGLLDADLYGPSIPTMLGTQERPEVSGQKLIPVERHGLKLMSIGFIVKAEEALSWRGPMLNGALTQFMRDVQWGELDYLIIDMPPGTGDVQLTIAQNLKVSGSVLVSTPQEVALADVIRGKTMFDKVDIPTLGVVENMAYFKCGDCGSKQYIFGQGGAARLAEKLSVPLLGEIPLETSARESADAGEPEVLRNPESDSAKAFQKVAEIMATTLAVKAQGMTAKPSGLKIIQ